MSIQRFFSHSFRRLFRYVAIVLAGLMLVSVNVQAGAYPRDEIAFCPSGGPSGWMNYFDKRDRERRWKKYQRYQQYQQALLSGYSHSRYSYPVLHQPNPAGTTYFTPQAPAGQGFGYR